jgi:hypothetical protein
MLNLDKYMLLLIVVMVFAGLFGGLINFFITKADDAENSNLARSLVVGTGASFLVPLFLNMIASSLVEATRGDSYKVLVFAGFCLVASISSGSFIRTLSDRVLNEAKAAKKVATEAKIEAQQAKGEIQEVQAAIDPIVEKGTEPETVPERDSTLRNAGAVVTPEEKILEAVAHNKYAYRTLKGIAKEVGVDHGEIITQLNELVERGLLGEKKGKQGNRLWFMTEKGLETLRA